MKTKLTKLSIIAWMLPTVAAQAALDFTGMPGSSIEFFGSGSQFQITPSASSSPYQWNITTPGPALGLHGQFTGGPWTYGPVNIVIPGIYENANVAGPLGNFIIDDGAGHPATGQVDWVQVSTFFSTGALNASALVNITGMHYSGGNSALLNLVAGGNGSVNMSFQFNPGMDLVQLTSGHGPYTTSYSGSFTPVAIVPEPATWIAGAWALVILIPLAVRTRFAGR